MGDGALPDVGDDLHVGMWMRRKPGARGNLVVVPDAQRAPPHPMRIEVVGKREMVFGLEPVITGAAQCFERSAFDHVLLRMFGVHDC